MMPPAAMAEKQMLDRTYLNDGNVSIAAIRERLQSRVEWASRGHSIFWFSLFAFSSPVRRRVAQAGQGVSARTDETTSHSTKLANDASQVAGYV